MAKRGWIDKNEYRVELAGRHYYFTVEKNKNRTFRVMVKEWQKSHGLRPSKTHSITIFENNLRDVVQALVKVAEKIGVDVGLMLKPKPVSNGEPVNEGSTLVEEESERR